MAIKASSLMLLGSTALLMGGACDGLRLPGRPAQSGNTTVETPAAATPKKPNRAAKPAAKVDPALDGQRFDQIRRSLRHLVIAEEGYYAENGVYTVALTRIGFLPEGESEVRFLWVSRGGWAASGTHPGMPGRDCVIYVGREHVAPTTLRDVLSGREGVPVCDVSLDARRPPAARDAPAAPSPPAPSPAATAPAPAPAPALSVPDTGSALDAVNPSVQMRVDLRNLVRSQDTYYGAQGVYARRVEPLALQFIWHRGVTITILRANDDSWSARATHASRPGKSCVVYMGPVAHRPATEAQQRVPERPAVPVCDD